MHAARAFEFYHIFRFESRAIQVVPFDKINIKQQQKIKFEPKFSMLELKLELELELKV